MNLRRVALDNWTLRWSLGEVQWCESCRGMNRYQVRASRPGEVLQPYGTICLACDAHRVVPS